MGLEVALLDEEPIVMMSQTAPTKGRDVVNYNKCMKRILIG